MDGMSLSKMASWLGAAAALLLAGVGGMQLTLGGDTRAAIGIVGYLLVGAALGVGGIVTRRGHAWAGTGAMGLALIIDLGFPAIMHTPLPPLTLVVIRDPVVLTVLGGAVGTFWILNRRSVNETTS